MKKLFYTTRITLLLLAISLTVQSFYQNAEAAQNNATTPSRSNPNRNIASYLSATHCSIVRNTSGTLKHYSTNVSQIIS